MGMDTKGVNEQAVFGKQEKLKLKDDGKWSPADIIRKTIEFFRCHACTFSWIQIVIVLPCTILMLLNQYYIKKLAHDFWPVPPPSPPSAMDIGLNDDPTPDEWETVIAVIVLQLLGFAYAISTIGALYFSVGSIYAGKTITFKDVLCCLPNLWNGLVITGLWGYLYFLLVLVAVSLLNAVLMTFVSIWCLPEPIVCLLTFSVAIILLFFIGTSVQIANGVTVFDQICGWPAFSKCRELLKTKWCVALILAPVYGIPETLLTFVIGASTWSCSGEWAKLVFLGVLTNLLSILLHLNVMSSALFYISCKECHQETVSADHFSFSQCQFEAGYQSIAAGSDQDV